MNSFWFLIFLSSDNNNVYGVGSNIDNISELSTVFPLLDGANQIGALHIGANKYFDGTKNKYSDIIFILTGGDCFFFEKELKNTIFAEPNLVLIGLNEILDYNE